MSRRTTAAGPGSAPPPEHFNARLTTKEVIAMRHARRTRGATLHSLAREYGTSHNNVHSVTSGRTWAHLNHPAPPVGNRLFRRRRRT